MAIRLIIAENAPGVNRSIEGGVALVDEFVSAVQVARRLDWLVIPTSPTSAAGAATIRPMAALEIWKLPERLERSLRSLVGDYAFDLDSLGHRLHLPGRLGHNLCLAADVTVGWGPDAADWEKAKTPFLRWFYRWYWAGRCPTCAGEKTIEIWRKGDASSDFHEETCPGCQGSGQMASDLAAASA